MKTLQDYMTGEQLQRIADQWGKNRTASSCFSATAERTAASIS